MSNFAALIDVLTIAGSRLSDGEPNSSGTVYFFQPGGNTPVNVYSDAAATTIVTQPLVLTSGGLVNIATVPNGLYVTQPVRVLIQDVSTNVVADTIYVPATAGDVGVDNPGFSDDNLDDVLTALYTSTGGTDGKYLESGGATERTIKAKFAEIWISVKDFGAVGDGIAIDTTAVQAAVNRVKALGGGVVYFPPGTYKTDQAITLSSTAGVSLVGAGTVATTISGTNATANAFTFTSCTDFVIRGIGITHATSSTGTAIALAVCSRVTIENCEPGALVFDKCIDASGAGADLFVNRCGLLTVNASATSRAIKTTCARTIICNSLIRSTGGAGIEFTGAASDGQVYANDFSVNGSNLVGILFNAATGSRFNIFSNPSLGAQATPIDVTAQAVWPTIMQRDNNVRPAEQTFATGTTVNPVIKLGNEIRLSATSGGAGTVTVGDPALLPTTVPGTDIYFTFVYKNSSGGAVTWDFTGSTVYKNSAAIPTTAAHTITVTYRWDPTGALLREVSRADTVT